MPDTSLNENIAAIAMTMGSHPYNNQVYEKMCDKLGGMFGLYGVAVQLAQSLDAWEMKHGGATDAYEKHGSSFYEMIDELVDDALHFMLTTEDTPAQDERERLIENIANTHMKGIKL